MYSDQMTSVYSGGLVYEYSEEGNGYGLVKVSGNSVSETDDFTALQNALKKTPAPSGDGGYKQNGQASQCPAKSSTWEVEDFSGQDLPAIPEGAEKYMKEGAGKGPGLTGTGSQNAGGASTGTATPGSGQVTNSASGTSSASQGAANAVTLGPIGVAPFLCTGFVLFFTLAGAALI